MHEVLDIDNSIILFNAPARNIDWFVDDGWDTRFERLEKEVIQIEKCYEKGLVTSAQEVVEYQKWKENYFSPSIRDIKEGKRI